MHTVEPARDSTRAHPHSLLIAASCLAVVFAVGALAACSAAAKAKDATIAKLAIGSWACASDDAAADRLPFTVKVTSRTFSVKTDAPATGKPADAQDELHGTWSVSHGTLDWGFKDVAMDRRFRVAGFDALTPKSKSFTIDDPGPFTSASPRDPDHQKILTTVHGTDSVTLQIPEGEPWTCHRQ